MAATARTNALGILAQPAVNHIGVQPVAQRYRGYRGIGLAAGLEHLDTEFGTVFAPRHSLRFHSIHLFGSWTLCLLAFFPISTWHCQPLTRLLLWLQYERHGATLAQMTVADCGAFMTFLQNIPARWISRVRAAPGQSGWAPFRGPLSHTSCRQAVVIVASLFSWLHAAQYLAANPWVLVNQATGEDRDHKMLDSKALSEAAMREVLRFVGAQPPSPSRARIRFILRFVEAVGLRSAELLGATVDDLRMEPEGWVMQVHGKGAKNRIAAVPGQALHALDEYLAARSLGSIAGTPWRAAAGKRGRSDGANWVPGALRACQELAHQSGVNLRPAGQ